MKKVKRCSFGGLVFGLWMRLLGERSESVGLGIGVRGVSGVSQQR